MHFKRRRCPQVCYAFLLVLVIPAVNRIVLARNQGPPSASLSSQQSKSSNAAQGRGASLDKPVPAHPTDQKPEPPTPTQLNQTSPVPSVSGWEKARTIATSAVSLFQLLLLLLQLALTVVGLVAAMFLFVWIKHGLFPVLQLRIELTELKKGVLFIRLTAENKSSVHLKLAPIDPAKGTGGARLQILEYETSQMERFPTFSEWVPFTEERVKKDREQAPWREPIQVMETTTHIEASESIRIELLHKPSPGVAVHCGFQVNTTPIREVLSQNRPQVQNHHSDRSQLLTGSIVRWWLRAVVTILDLLPHDDPTARFTTTAWILMSAPTEESTNEKIAA